MPPHRRADIKGMSRNTGALVVRALARTRCGAYLLVRRARTERSFPGRWELPGGKAETGEPAAAALVRELGEETGVTCTSEPRLVAQARRRSPRSTEVLELCFVVETAGEPALSPEHDAVSLYRPGGPLPGALTESSASFLREAA
jgi:8-oxo-dGTP diphosphatase